MNVIDRSFQQLVKDIRSQSLEEVSLQIRKNYERCPVSVRNILENYFVQYPYWGKLNKSQGEFEELENRAKSLKNHLEDYEMLYQNLGDYRSKKILFAILNNWYHFDIHTLNSCIEKNFDHYFDLDLIPDCEREVFVDLGSYTGDTVLDYFKNYGMDSYQKIYCYEITDESFQTLTDNLAHYPRLVLKKNAVSDCKGKVFLKENSEASANTIASMGEKEVDAVMLDEDIPEELTLVKMDIEGAEAKALEGMKKHIAEEHPKLFISVYHNHEDLWKIPKMIQKLDKSYRFYLRYYGSNVFPTEVVLFAL